MASKTNPLFDKERVTGLKYLATKSDLESKINSQTTLIIAALILMTAVIGFLVTQTP